MATRNAATRPNFFILLGLNPNALWDQTAFENALKTMRNEWSRQTNWVGQRARVAKQNLVFIPEIKRVMADEALRALEAEAARAIIASNRQSRFDAFEKRLDFINAVRSIEEADLNKLIDDFQDILSPSEVRARITVPIISPVAVKKLVEQLDPTIAKKILDLLQVVNMKTLYEALQLPSVTATPELYRVAEELYKAVVRRMPKTADVTALTELAGLAMEVFKTEDTRRRYDESLRQGTIDSLLKDVEVLMSRSVNRNMDIEQVTKFLESAEQAGWDQEEALTKLEEFCQQHKWTVPTKIGSWASRLLKTITRHIQHAYATNPHLGLALWFDEFDRNLPQHKYIVCQGLIEEIREEGYLLSATEYHYVDSRQGSLLLCQGISHHQRGVYLQARRCYEESYHIYHRLNDEEGEGQVALALDDLQKQQLGRGNDPQLLELLATNPRVLGDSTTLLVKRITTLPSADQIQVILAAKQLGYLSPLSKGLLSNEIVTQGAAASALAWLQPGPEYGALLEMLTSANWMVRWQAAFILGQRAEKQPQDFAQQREWVRNAVVRQLVEGEQDPMVRREMILLLREIDEGTETPLLIKLLRDSDPDVRFAAVEALAKIGNRTAIAALHRVREGSEFHSNLIKKHALEAVKRIEERHPNPLPEVHKMAICLELTNECQPGPSRLLFLSFEDILCVVTLAHPKPGLHVSCEVLLQDEVIVRQEQIISVSLTDHSATHFFALSPPAGAWMLGNYVVRLLIEGEVQKELATKVMNQEPLGAAEAAILLDQYSPQAYCDKAIALYDLKRFEEALEACEQAILLDPKYAPAYTYKGSAFCGLKHYEKALNACEKSILLDPQYAPGYIYKGDAAFYLKHYEDALKYYEQAILLAPECAPAYCGKGATLSQLQCYEEAIEACEQAILLDPIYALAYNNKNESLFYLQRYEEAIEACEQAILLDPTSALFYSNKGVSLIALKRYEEALNVFDQAILLNPELAHAYRNKGNVLYALQCYEEALETCEQAILLDPKYLFAYSDKGSLLLALQKNEEALEAYDQAIRIDPNNGNSYNGRGVALYKLQRYQEALVAYDQAILLDPSVLTYHNNRASVLNHL